MTQSTMSLGRRTVSGAFWTSLARICQHGMSLVSASVLARLLTPSIYGVVGMVTVIIGFISIFRTLGTATAIVQRKELSPRFISSVFWMNVVLGALTTAGGMLLSPAVAWLYREQQVAPVMFWLSINFFVSGISSVHEALLIRAMEFRRLAIIEVTATLVQAAVAIAMAAKGYGVWSLVGASLAMNLVNTAMLFRASGMFPKLQMDWPELKSTLSFSLNLSGFNIVNYFGRNADNFLIGRYLGTTQLGYYQFAYNLMLFPVQNIAHQLGRVTFPALVQMQDDNARFRRAYLRSCAVVATVTFPMMMGLLAVAGPFVATLLGPQWSEVAPIITVLACVGMMQSVVATVGQIYVSKGRTDLLFRTAVVSNLFILPAFVIGLRWGALGVAVAYAITYSAVTYFLLIYAFRLVDLRLSEFAATLSWCLKYSVIMFGCIVALRLALDAAGVTRPQTVLACCVTTGVVVYGALLFLRKPPVIVDLLKSGLLDSVPGVAYLVRRVA
jgi:PST family polysaccharide transporter